MAWLYSLLSEDEDEVLFELFLLELLRVELVEEKVFDELDELEPVLVAREPDEREPELRDPELVTWRSSSSDS